MARIAALKPDENASLFICKAYFNRPNIHDPNQDQQKRFYSFDYHMERENPPAFETLAKEQELLKYNGYYKMLRWIDKARQDRAFKHAYIYTNHIHDEKGMPMEIRLFMPYLSTTNQQILQNLNKPHHSHSIFKMVVFYHSEEVGKPDEVSTHYSRDFDIEREEPPTSAVLTKKLKNYAGYRFLAQKAAVIQQENPKYKSLILYANLLGEGKGLEILRASRKTEE